MDVSIPGTQLKQKTLQGYRFVSENDLEARLVGIQSSQRQSGAMS